MLWVTKALSLVFVLLLLSLLVLYLLGSPLFVLFLHFFYTCLVLLITERRWGQQRKARLQPPLLFIPTHLARFEARVGESRGRLEGLLREDLRKSK